MNDGGNTSVRESNREWPWTPKGDWTTWNFGSTDKPHWVVRAQYIKNGLRHTGFIAVCDGGGQPNQDNARLFAHAPRLVGELELLLDRYDLRQDDEQRIMGLLDYLYTGKNGQKPKHTKGED